MYIKDFVPMKNKTVISWLISYTIILIIPMIIGSFAYFASVKTINEEVNKVHSASLQQFKMFMDGKLEEANQLCKEISLDENVKILMNAKPPIQQSKLYSIRNVQNSLKRFEMSNNMIDGIYVYFRNSHFVVSSNFLYREDRFGEINEDNLGLSNVEMFRLIDATRTSAYKLVRKDAGGGRYHNKVIIIQSLLSSYTESPPATILIVLNEEKLDESIRNLTWTANGMMLVADGSDEFIGSGQEERLPDILESHNLEKSANIFYSDYNNAEVAVTYTKSDINDWNYISVIPLKTYLQKVQYIKTIIYVYVILCLIIGVVLSYYLAKRNYNPIKKIMQMLVNNLGKPKEGVNNDFSFLEKSLTDLFSEKESFIKRLDQQADAMRDNVIARLLKGRVSNALSAADQLDASGIRFLSDRFMVMIYSPEDFGSMFGDAVTDEKTINLAFFIIRNVAEELTSEKHLGYMTEVGGMMVCLVNVSEVSTDEEAYAEMHQIASKAREFINDNFNIDLSVSIGEIHTSMAGIERAYSEAVEALEYKTLAGTAERIIHYSTVKPANRSSFEDSLTLDKEKKFINYIMIGDYKSAAYTLDDITNHYLIGVNSLPLIKCRMFGLVNSMLNAVGEIKTSVEFDFFEELDPVNKLLNAKTMVELKDQINLIFNKINEYYESKSSRLLSRKADEIVSYVREHCLEPNINITELSDKFQISRSYISRIFKKSTGMGLVDFIHELRLEKAKELMRDTDLSIKDISEKVGFSHSVTMNRAFRKIEGVTPGKFRNIE